MLPLRDSPARGVAALEPATLETADPPLATAFAACGHIICRARVSICTRARCMRVLAPNQRWGDWDSGAYLLGEAVRLGCADGSHGAVGQRWWGRGGRLERGKCEMTEALRVVGSSHLKFDARSDRSDAGRAPGGNGREPALALSLMGIKFERMKLNSVLERHSCN